jgi:hypothetical protein
VWAPEPIWTTWRIEKSYPYGDSNYDPSAVQPVVSRYTDCAIPNFIVKHKDKLMQIHYFFLNIRSSIQSVAVHVAEVGVTLVFHGTPIDDLSSAGSALDLGSGCA